MTEKLECPLCSCLSWAVNYYGVCGMCYYEDADA